MNLARAASVQVDVVGTEGGDFELESVFQNDNDSKVRTDRIGAREQFLHFLWSRVSRDVDVFRREIAHHVADTAASKKGGVVVFAQFCRDGARCFFHCLHTSSVAAPVCRGELESTATERRSYSCRAPVPGCQLGDRQAGFLLVEPYSSERAPALQVCSRESIASIFGRGGRFLSQGMNDEADDCDTDAGIGDVESRPGIGKANM